MEGGMSASAEIIEKIKKLLRLARSSNPHEAQMAMQRALELAHEHDVAIDGLNPDVQAQVKKVTHQYTEPVIRFSYEKESAIRICQTFFKVTAVYCSTIIMRDGWPQRGRKVIFVGTATDIEIALYVYGFLTHHFSYCWRKHRGRLRNRQAFIQGMVAGIVYVLRQAQPKKTPEQIKGTELILVEHDSYISAVIGKTSVRKHLDPDHNASAAFNAGVNHGLTTNIVPALKPGDRTEMLTLT